jgi:hypothetical protein
MAKPGAKSKDSCQHQLIRLVGLTGVVVAATIGLIRRR